MSYYRIQIGDDRHHIAGADSLSQALRMIRSMQRLGHGCTLFSRFTGGVVKVWGACEPTSFWVKEG